MHGQTHFKSHKSAQICSKEAVGFLKISKSFHELLAAETHLEDGECLQVAVNRAEVLKLRGRTGISVTVKRKCNILKLNKNK